MIIITTMPVRRFEHRIKDHLNQIGNDKEKLAELFRGRRVTLAEELSGWWLWEWGGVCVAVAVGMVVVGRSVKRGNGIGLGGEGGGGKDGYVRHE